MPRTGLRDTQSLVPLAILTGALVLLALLWSIFIVFVLAGFVAFLLAPVVRFLERSFPRILAIAVVYLAVIILGVIIIGLLVPVVSTQFQDLVKSTPGYVAKARAIFNQVQTRYVAIPENWKAVADRGLSELQDLAIRLTREAVPALVNVFTGLFGLFFIPLLAFFMLLDSSGYQSMLLAITPPPHRATVQNLLHCMGQAVWAFVRGEFTLMAVVGTAVGLGLYLVGMPYPAVFGLIAGLLELIPSFGPVFTTILVASVGLAIEPVLALKGVAVTISVQLLENAFLVPVIMAKTVGLDPVTIAFSVFLGSAFAGIVGAVIAIPIALIAKIVILYFYVDQSELPGKETTVCPMPKPRRRPPRRQPRYLGGSRQGR